jgi:phosphoribosylformylglycinamidine synthase I
MTRVRIGVLQFPGLNCETETLRALGWAGVDGELVRWNEPATRLATYAGYVIPGGFSYQDRVRAGAIAAKSPLMDELARQAERGKPVLGLCNGAQILVEAGLAPATAAGHVDAALARNNIAGWEGYHARWVFVRAPTGARCFFTEGLAEPLPMPVAHGEGRFLFGDPAVDREIERRGLRALVYCTPDGEEAAAFPDNPNGSTHALAGLAGLDGQVLAFMPHPERAARLWHVPEDLPGPWGERRRRAASDFAALSADGPGMRLLRAFARLGARGGS